MSKNNQTSDTYTNTMPDAMPNTMDEVIALYQTGPSAPLEIVWSDPWLIAINKPANELSVPGKPPLDQRATVLRASEHFGQALVIHRLDGATSGLLLFARNSWIQRQMHTAFRLRCVHKIYCALVEGEVQHPCGSIDLPLGRDWLHRPYQKLDWQMGKASLTHWQRLDDGAFGQQCSRLKLKPITGRSHQLRVHLLALGHPILGDRLYHPNYVDSTQKRQLSPRLHLHAEQLAFYHPITGERIALKAKCPF